MEQEMIHCPDGLYSVDWTLVESIIRSNLYANGLQKFSKEEVTEKWIGPDIHHWTVDWDKVIQEKKRAAEFTNELREQAKYVGMQGQLRELERMVRQTRQAKETWHKNGQAAQRKTMSNINASVDKLEMGKEVATAVRDVSGGVLVIGATILSGGSLAGLTGAAALGGTIDAATKFQDTGNGSAAAFSFVSGFTINMIPGAKVTAQVSEKVVMFVLKAKFSAMASGGIALIEGKTAQEAVAASLESAVSSGIGAGLGPLLKTAAAKKLLGKLVYPAAMKIRFKDDNYLGRLRNTKDLAHGVVGAVAGEATKRGVGYVSSKIREKSAPLKPSRPIVDNSILVDELLLNRAVQGPGESRYRKLRPWD